ncbi:EamA family transporter [Sphingobacterium corticis]|uniref:EamA family transporter n=1 Tax=Sphingobacterium corticis TaxID=1812823 RepID=A0ABW5NLA5_9SPHI
MHFVLISVLCSVSVAVLLKYARKIGLDTWQMIVWNYPVAICLTYFIFTPDLANIHFSELPWVIYLPMAVLLPTLFLLLSNSLRYAGLVQTEVAQRLSLVISLLAAVWLFREQFSVMRSLGIAVGFAAIACLIGWQKEVGSVTDGWKRWLFPLTIFVGYGTVDILYKLVALEKTVAYTTSMFFMFLGAMTLSAIILVTQLVSKRKVFSSKAMGAGLLLGVLNFGNILFYMKAHRILSDSPSVVFTGMNIGVIGLGALIGVWLFRERLSLLNVVGILLAVVSVLMIAYL